MSDESVLPLSPAIGDYVLATKWSDGDPGDPWAVGFYAGLCAAVPSSPRHMVHDSRGVSIRPNGYRRVGRITPEIGKWLLDNSALLEGAPGKLNLWGLYDWERVNWSLCDDRNSRGNAGSSNVLRVIEHPNDVSV